MFVDPTYDPKPSSLRHTLALAACNDGTILEELLKLRPEELRYVDKTLGRGAWRKVTPSPYVIANKLTG